MLWRVVGSDVVIGSFTLGAVALTAVLGAGIEAVRRRHDAGVREREARKRVVTELVTAAEHLHDAVRLFRVITAPRRSWLFGIATGMAQEYRELEGDTSWAALLVRLVWAARDLFKIGGLVDQMLDSSGARYQEMVTPPLQRVVAAAVTVQLDESGELGSAAGELQRAAGKLADEAQSGKRAYERVEAVFKRALRDVQAAAVRLGGWGWMALAGCRGVSGWFWGTAGMGSWGLI